MKKILSLAVAGLLVLSQSACVSTPKVAVVQMGDDNLTCDQLKAEYQKLDAIDKEADENKSVNGRNVAAAVFFWPAVVSTVMSADDAQKRVEQRRTRLVELAKAKNCS